MTVPDRTVHDPDRSDLRCDSAGMTCVVTNLQIDGDGNFYLLFDSSRKDLLRYSGFFGHFGIGEPAAYFYIDGWTFTGSKACLDARVRRGFRKVEAERQTFPNSTFVPIYLKSGFVAGSFETVHNLTMFFQVLWKANFFRKLYAGAAVVSTCQFWFSQGYCIPNSSKMKFVYFGEEHEDRLPFGDNVVRDMRNKRFESAVLGISKRFLLPEREILMADNPDLPLMVSGYRSFAEHLRPGYCGPASKDQRRIFVYRRGNERRVINWRDIANKFRLTPVVLERLTLDEQICTMSNAELVVGAHGAAMAHIMFMRPRNLAIELFPCNFKKTVYRNLALISGAKYRWWIAGDPNDCPDLPSGTVDWTSISSKNSFRNQNFVVDVAELQRIVEFRRQKTLFLAYMPFEQFNNQLISLRCACAMAAILNRTLVLPEIGHQVRRGAKDIGRRLIYEPKEYEWQPISRYFNTTILYNELPCRSVPYSAYYAEVRQVDRIYFRRLGARYNHRAQPESYFYHVAGLSYTHHRSLPYTIPIYNDRQSIQRHFGDYSRSLQHFVLGNVFWMYNFDAPLEYPITRYVDVYKEDGSDGGCYRRITKALSFAHRLQAIADDGFKPPSAPLYGAIHWRRGDYHEKCREESLPASCYPSYRQVALRLAKVDPNRAVTWALLSNVPVGEMGRRLRRRGFKLHSAGPCLLDPIECAIIDQAVAVDALVFIGNMYSSFTRSIADKRSERGLPSEFF